VTSYRVVGRTPLSGEIEVVGAKNASLPGLVAAALAGETVLLSNFPNVLSDVQILSKLLISCGTDVRDQGGRISVSPGQRAREVGANQLSEASKLRHSLLLLGYAAFHGIRIQLPASGGCAIGSRKIDLHLDVLRSLGCHVEDIGHAIEVDPSKGLVGANIQFHYPSFGATLNFMFAAVRADGTSILRNAATNPEVLWVSSLLNAMGAKIEWDATRTLRVHGSSATELSGVNMPVMGDRIVGATCIAAVGCAGGSIKIVGVEPKTLSRELEVWRDAGLSWQVLPCGALAVKKRRRLSASSVTTVAYPGFHTDNQPAHAAMMTLAEGTSYVRETILDGRFAYAGELAKLGADVSVEPGGFVCANDRPGEVLTIRGVQKLVGSEVHAPDLRGGAALVLAGLAANGVTCVRDPDGFIDRGYSHLEAILAAVGADVVRSGDASSSSIDTP